MIYTDEQVRKLIEVAADAAANKALELTQVKVLELVKQRDDARRNLAGAWDAGYAAAILDVGQQDEPPSMNPFHNQ